MIHISYVKHLRTGFFLCLLGLGLERASGFRHVWLDRNMEGGTGFSTLFSVALLSTSLLCLAIIFSPSIQAFAIRPTSQIGFIRNELWFTCILTGILGIDAFYGAILK